MFAWERGELIVKVAERCIAELKSGMCRITRLREPLSSRTFSRDSGTFPARANQIAFRSSALWTMSFPKHGRFDDTCQDNDRVANGRRAATYGLWECDAKGRRVKKTASLPPLYSVSPPEKCVFRGRRFEIAKPTALETARDVDF